MAGEIQLERLDPQAAIIDERKVREYLLSPSHRLGRPKVSFFGVLGYRAGTWERFAHDLRKQHLRRVARLARTTDHGRMYLIKAPLTGPTGRSAVVVTIWIVRTGETAPRLVTAYPERRRE